MNHSTFQLFNLSTRRPMKRNFSTFQPFNFSTLAAVAALAATVALAEPPQDSNLTLGEVGLPTWMPAYGSGYAAPEAAYPISAAAAPVLPEDEVTAASTKNTLQTWSLKAWTAGRTLSEQSPSAKIGDFCRDIPLSRTIDWKKTIEANAEAVAAGLILFDQGSTNPRERLLFTASGAVTVTWVKKDGTSELRTYQVGATSSSRPYRVYATRVDEGNSAAFIDLSGKFVKFFGDSRLLSSRWETTGSGSSGVSNVVYGLVMK